VIVTFRVNGLFRVKVVQGKKGMNFYPVIWGFPKNGGFPQQPCVFLLKLIIFIFCGVFLGGTTILRKHPLW